MRTGGKLHMDSSLRVHVVAVSAMFFAGLVLGHLDANNKAMWCRELTLLGNRQFLRDDYATAKLAYESALQFDDDNPTAQNNLACTVRKMKELNFADK